MLLFRNLNAIIFSVYNDKMIFNFMFVLAGYFLVANSNHWSTLVKKIKTKYVLLGHHEVASLKL